MRIPPVVFAVPAVLAAIGVLVFLSIVWTFAVAVVTVLFRARGVHRTDRGQP